MLTDEDVEYIRRWVRDPAQRDKLRDALGGDWKFAGDLVLAQHDELAQLRAEVEYLCGVNSTFLRDHHADQDTAARLRDEVARLRKERGRLLMSDRPWSLRSVVERLCGFAEHMLRDLHYDGHGHEGIKYAAESGREWLDALARGDGAS